MNYRPIVFSNRLVPESVRWLMTHGKIAQAETMLKRVAKMNRKEMPDDTLGLPRDQKGTQQEAGFTDLFRSPLNDEEDHYLLDFLVRNGFILKIFQHSRNRSMRQDLQSNISSCY